MENNYLELANTFKSKVQLEIKKSKYTFDEFIDIFINWVNGNKCDFLESIGEEIFSDIHLTANDYFKLIDILRLTPFYLHFYTE